MRRLHFKSLVLVVLAAWQVLIGASTEAAATLHHSDPLPDAMLDRSPMEVLTWFSVPITAGSDLRIFDADFNDMATNEPSLDPGDVTLMRLAVQPLSPGRYTVKWRAESRDGSISEGEFKFTVAHHVNLTTTVAVLLGIGAMLLTLLGSAVGWWLLRHARRVRQ